MAGESLYPYVLEDYLSYFLPCMSSNAEFFLYYVSMPLLDLMPISPVHPGDGTTPPRLPFQLSHSPRPSSPHQVKPSCSPLKLPYSPLQLHEAP